MLSVPKTFAALAAAGFVVTALLTQPWKRGDAPGGAPSPTATTTAPSVALAGTKPTVHVWKTPGCDCCSGWVDHLRAAGYPVEVEEADLDAVREARGVPTDLASCHTALIDGYMVEGHVPVDVVDRMLAERPDIAGIAVPGMPVGTPGMEMGNQQDHYQVLAFAKDGSSTVYAER